MVECNQVVLLRYNSMRVKKIMEKPSWSIGLTRIGEYYEGIVNNVENTLELHRKVTVTMYGARTSFKSSIIKKMIALS